MRSASLLMTSGNLSIRFPTSVRGVQLLSLLWLQYVMPTLQPSRCHSVSNLSNFQRLPLDMHLKLGGTPSPSCPSCTQEFAVLYSSVNALLAVLFSLVSSWRRAIVL